MQIGSTSDEAGIAGMTQPWKPIDYCLKTSPDRMEPIATEVYRRVCRSDFADPGFAVVDLGDADSRTLRRAMIELKSALDALHQAQTGRDLAYLSAGRFDQQVTTKLHRDGGPVECFLMLGYEPTPIEAELALADYTRCAYDRGLTPAEFLERHNPMFAAGERLLEPYTTRLACFSNRRAVIVLVNNSEAAFDPTGRSWQGVLHTATVLNPSEALRRVINSTMITSVAPGASKSVTAEELETFATTGLVRRRGYDKPLADDDR
jgi:hypothetical protein